MANENAKKLLNELDRVRRHDGSTQEWDVKYEFESSKWSCWVEEADDHHVFVSGVGDTPEEAAANAAEGIPEATEFWGWTYQ